MCARQFMHITQRTRGRHCAYFRNVVRDEGPEVAVVALQVRLP